MILEIEPNIALDFLTVGKHVLAPGRACPGLSQPVFSKPRLPFQQESSFIFTYLSPYRNTLDHRSQPCGVYDFISVKSIDQLLLAERDLPQKCSTSTYIFVVKLSINCFWRNEFYYKMLY